MGCFDDTQDTGTRPFSVEEGGKTSAPPNCPSWGVAAGAVEQFGVADNGVGTLFTELHRGTLRQAADAGRRHLRTADPGP